MMMLRCVAQPVEHLQCQRLFFRKKFKFAVTEAHANAGIKSQCFRRTPPANSTKISIQIPRFPPFEDVPISQ